jgi:hypothetical protein
VGPILTPWTTRETVHPIALLFFGSPDAELPKSESDLIASDDRLLQPGFLSDGFAAGGLLVVGINPGNGLRAVRSAADEQMMPHLYAFSEKPSYNTYYTAMAAQNSAFFTWNGIGELLSQLGAADVQADQLAYINALPYRSARSAFPKADRKLAAATHWVRPLLDALHPGVIVAFGVATQGVIELARRGSAHPRPITYNRVRIAEQRKESNANFVIRLRESLQDR